MLPFFLLWLNAKIRSNYLKIDLSQYWLSINKFEETPLPGEFSLKTRIAPLSSEQFLKNINTVLEQKKCDTLVKLLTRQLSQVELIIELAPHNLWSCTKRTSGTNQ